MAEKNQEYLSDDELQRLIAEVEADGMLRAPSYLKAEIFSKLDSGAGRRKRASKGWRLFTYSAKVAFGAAAAIAMLWIVPSDLLHNGTWMEQAEAVRDVGEEMPQGRGNERPGVLMRTAVQLGMAADSLCGFLGNGVNGLLSR